MDGIQRKFPMMWLNVRFRMTRPISALPAWVLRCWTAVETSCPCPLQASVRCPPFLTPPPPKISGAGVKGRHQKCSVIGIRLWEEEEEELDAASTAFPSTESTYKGKGNSARWVLISVRIHTTSGVGRAWRRAGEWAGQGRAGQPAGSGTREELQRAPWGQPLMR